MTKGNVKEILNKVMAWPKEDQERVAHFVRQVEQWRDTDITDTEWNIIEKRAARRQFASARDIKELFNRYRNA